MNISGSKFARSRLPRMWSDSSDAVLACGSSSQASEGRRREPTGASSVETGMPFINESKHPKTEKNKRPFSGTLHVFNFLLYFLHLYSLIGLVAKK